MPRMVYMKQFLDAYELAQQIFNHATWMANAEDMLMGSDSETEMRGKMMLYEKFEASFKEGVSRVLGTNVLSLVGVKEPNLSSHREAIVSLGSCAMNRTPDYTRQYFNIVSPAQSAA